MEGDSLYILRNSSTLIQFLAAIIASFYFYKYRGSFLKYFLWFLWITVFVEVLAYTIKKFNLVNSNALVYNIYCIIAFLFLFQLYIKAINDQNKKRILRIASISYIIVLIVAGFFENYLVEPQTISYVFAELVLILGIGLYLVEILKSEKALYANKSLLFWISLGLLLFSVGTIPFTIVMSYYIIDGIGIHRAFAINFILIIIQNICFIIGFIRADKNQVV